MIIRDRALLSRPPESWLPGLLQEFLRGAPRLEKLRRYAMGRHDVLCREREAGLPNARLPHAFARYIAQLSSAYLLGAPVRYEDERRPEAVRALETLHLEARADQADDQLAWDQAVYGRAVSLCYHGEQGRVGIAALDPRGAFVVYDDTVRRQALCGVHMAGGPGGTRVTVYTARERLHFAPRALPQAGRLERRCRHLFGGVPMVEYWNDQEGQGDFEGVLALIDAYDELASDRVNDRAQFADALLVLTGVMGLGTGEDPYDWQGGARRLRQDRTLALPDSDAQAKWLVKDPQERDIDTLRQALASDIHKFSMTPDFGDERFAGNVSGIAIKYKLFCLEQRIRLKEKRFAAGLRARVGLLSHYLASTGRPAPDAAAIRIIFERHLPESELERAQTLRLLSGIQAQEEEK